MLLLNINYSTFEICYAQIHFAPAWLKIYEGYRFLLTCRPSGAFCTTIFNATSPTNNGFIHSTDEAFTLKIENRALKIEHSAFTQQHRQALLLYKFYI